MVMTSIVLLTSCTRGGLIKEYKEDYDFFYYTAMEECPKHGQVYIQHYSPDLISWEVLCYQSSPVRFFTYVISA